MEFGLWVEPEMVNPDSDLFRAYPDWVLSGSGGPGRLPQPWRNQQVLDLAIPDCYSYLRDRLDALLGEHDIDLGILARSDRVWASDTNDALERQPIQRWTQLPVPPELVGSHVGPPRSHTTGRVHDPAFRVATALFRHFGIEWDIASA
jgi:alpha-galactosidase